jgi:hypothetical protein
MARQSIEGGERRRALKVVHGSVERLYRTALSNGSVERLCRTALSSTTPKA